MLLTHHSHQLLFFLFVVVVLSLVAAGLMRSAVVSLSPRCLLLVLLLLSTHGFCPFGTTRRRKTQCPPHLASTPKTTTTTTPYPTQRGETVDARAIVSQSNKHRKAVRCRHILFRTEDLARHALHELNQNTTLDFATLATLVSACTVTREKGGNVGWVSAPPDSSNNNDNNEHLDDFFPVSTTLWLQAHKPGDVLLLPSHLGYHLVQIVDVMMNVRDMAAKRMRKKSSRGILSGALNGHNDEKDVELTYKMETMGCQMNQADSERMEGQLQNLGMRPLSENEERPPDMIILNTCSIRDHAEQKVYSYLGPHAKRKRDGEDVTIVVAGCVAQQEGQALLRRAPEVDLVMGPQYANRIGDFLEDVANGNQVVATEATHIMEDSTKPRRQSETAAWVNVIYGCNERCSFCIVPSTRGVEQSRPAASIVTEVENLVAQGYKEVTLLGQNIDAYGRDMIPKQKFSDLVRTVGSVDGLQRLRFVTSHPKYMSLGVVDAVHETPAACESFHIPFQSGSNRILQAMGRGHTREKYLHIVERIRSRIPEAAITADVIVGFPGETDQDFEDTLSLMNEVVFDTVHTAAYSPRPNTPAASLTDQVLDQVKKERLQRINELNKQHAAQRRARLMGRTVEVLVEERNIRVPSQVMGRTRHGYIVYCDGDIDELRGELLHVKIDTCETYYLAGQEVSC